MLKRYVGERGSTEGPSRRLCLIGIPPFVLSLGFLLGSLAQCVDQRTAVDRILRFEPSKTCILYDDGCEVTQGSRPVWRDIFHHPVHLELKPEAPVTNDVLRDISALCRLRELWVESEGGLDWSFVRKLARLEYLSVVVLLNSDGKCQRYWTDRDVAAIRSLPALRVLLLSVTDSDLAALLKANGLSGVVDLSIRPARCLPGLESSEPGFRGSALGALRNLRKLRSLDLSLTEISDDALRSLNGMESLRRLSLDDTKVRGRGLAYLTHLPHLERVSVINTKVDDEAIITLRELKPLRTLQVQGTPVTAAGVARFEKARPDVEVIRNGPARIWTDDQTR